MQVNPRLYYIICIALQITYTLYTDLFDNYLSGFDQVEGSGKRNFVAFERTLLHASICCKGLLLLGLVEVLQLLHQLTKQLGMH